MQAVTEKTIDKRVEILQLIAELLGQSKYFHEMSKYIDFRAGIFWASDRCSIFRLDFGFDIDGPIKDGLYPTKVFSGITSVEDLKPIDPKLTDSVDWMDLEALYKQKSEAINHPSSSKVALDGKYLALIGQIGVVANAGVHLSVHSNDTPILFEISNLTIGVEISGLVTPLLIKD